MLRTDDELGAVNAEFLGPSGYTFPWRARYSAYGIGVGLTVLLLLFVHRFHVPLNFFTVTWLAAGVVFATRAVGQLVTYETPLRALAVTFGHELAAPRPGRKADVAVLRPGKVRVIDHGRHVCRGCEACQ